LAESIYPTLPERERLPTNALFLAAEEILPQRGYDAENAPSHISRLIFKIGGQRSGETLGDKFKSVLEGIGIKLEFVPSSPDQARPPSTASFALTDDTGHFDIALPRLPRRRHSDASRPGEHHELSDEVTYELPVRPHSRPQSRSVSFLDRGAPSIHGFARGYPARHDVDAPGFGVTKERPASSSTAANTDLTHPSSPSEGGFNAVHMPRFSHEELPAVDIEDLETKLEQLRRQDDQDLLRGVFGTWRATARQTKQKNEELVSLAVEYDNNDLLGEVLDIWNEEAFLAEEQRLKAEAAAKYQVYISKMEKRATRAYEIFTIHNVLDRWQDRAQEEVERTALARRHIVRKRAFEGWRDQHLEDETKVKNFILEGALQKWSQVALHHEVRHKVAEHWHDQQLCKQTLNTMWRESKEQLADNFHISSLAEECLDTWANKARHAREEYQVAAAIDERLLLDEAVNIWQEETEVLQDKAYETTRQFLILGVRRNIEHWQEQARLQALLKQFNAKDQEATKHQVLETWHGAYQEAKCNAALADAFVVQEPVDHWEREMKLKLFIERDEYETKVAVLNRWSLEEKLAWFKRHLETRTKKDMLNTFLAAARQARGTRERQEQEADYVDIYYTQADVVDTWLSETDKMWRHGQNADLVSLYRTARPCMEHWRERCNESVARGSYYKRRADKHRRRSIVTGVLDKWPAVAETARRERMMSSLRQFRRKYKVDLAQSCLNTWLGATADAIDASRDAHNIHLHYKREDVNDYLDHWNDTAQKAQDIQQVAADAELEVYFGKWQGQLHEAQDNMHDAFEYDAEQTRTRCLEKWEFQTLQQQGKRHMAATIQDRNEKRLCSQILDDWQQKAVPEAAARIDPRHSTLSRRSIRHQLARSSVGGYRTQRSDYPATPHVTVSQLGRSAGMRESTHFATRSFRSLGPMPEFDEESFAPDAENNDPGFMSTPTKWTGCARPLGYRPSTAFTNNTTTPSAILPSPYERELRQQHFGGVQKQRGVEFADISENSAEDLYR
jgi:protein SFI1